MKKHLLFLIITLALQNIGKAQNQVNTSFIDKNRLGVGLNISTNGLGAQLAYSILKKDILIARAEARYNYSEIKDKEATLQQTPMIVNGYIKRGSLGFLLDYHPFNNAFKLSTGFAILLNEVNNVAKLRDSSVQGNIKISPDEVGTITIGYNLKPSPYFGIGFGKSVPKKRIGFSFEIGFYYTGIPTMTYATTKMLEPMQNSIKNANYPVFVDDWYNNYGENSMHDEIPILPVINCGLNIRLGQIGN
jgi:hypothetical protein